MRLLFPVALLAEVDEEENFRCSRQAFHRQYQVTIHSTVAEPVVGVNRRAASNDVFAVPNLVI